MNEAPSKRHLWVICFGLALAVLAVYGQLWHAGFIRYDDPDYVSANSHVLGGVNWADIKWAFTTMHSFNWHPLTWISHMADAQVYGSNAGGHHLTNVALHMTNSILLFLLLRRLTMALWPSAMVAALFALHPMHVESVAWVSERKDVLSALFWMLSIWAYGRSVAGNETDKRFRVLSVALFALGLMAKPMLVTLPFVLLLLDYWPLGRQGVPLAALVREKLPFFILAAASCVVTYIAQNHGGAVMTLAMLPLHRRLANIPVAYVRYIEKTFWPLHLSIAYPMRKWSFLIIAGACLILLAATAVAFLRRRQQPWLAVGWLWFMGTLIPVIGVVQVGTQAMADRYNYIPSIGLFIAIVWSLREWSGRLGRPWTAVICGLVLGGCAILTGRQAACWIDDQSLYLHAVHNTEGNYLAYVMLATDEAANGHTNTAVNYLNKSLEFNPNFPLARNQLGRILFADGRIDEALVQLQRAVSLDPKLANARYNLGYALLAKGRTADALDQFQAQIDLDPTSIDAQKNMGTVLLQNGLPSDAAEYLKAAVALNPKNDEAHYLLGNALFRLGLTADAISQYEKSIQLKPDDVQAANDLAWILACDPDASVRNGPKALELALRADQNARGQNPVVTGTLAAGYAEVGKFPDAIATEQRACQTARGQTNAALAEALEKRLRSYQAGRAWRDTNSRRK